MRKIKVLFGLLSVVVLLSSFGSSAYASEGQIGDYKFTEAEYNMLAQYYSPEEIEQKEQALESAMKDIESRGAIVTADEYINGSRAGSYNGITARSGDILVARKNGGPKPINWVGHAAIVTNGGSSITHFPGIGLDPEEDTLKSFFQENSEVFVLRHNNYNISIAAAQWANHYLDRFPKATYSIASARDVQNPNYCSKFVWQAYYFGAGQVIATFGDPFPLYPMNLVTDNQGTVKLTYVE